MTKDLFVSGNVVWVGGVTVYLLPFWADYVPGCMLSKIFSLWSALESLGVISGEWEAEYRNGRWFFCCSVADVRLGGET